MPKEYIGGLVSPLLRFILYFLLQHPLQHLNGHPYSANRGPSCFTSVILRELMCPTWLDCRLSRNYWMLTTVMEQLSRNNGHKTSEIELLSWNQWNITYVMELLSWNYCYRTAVMSWYNSPWTIVIELYWHGTTVLSLNYVLLWNYFHLTMYCYGTTFMELPSGNCHTISGTYLIIVIELLYTVIPCGQLYQ